MGNTQMEALHKLEEIFNRATGATQAKSKPKNNEITKHGIGIPRVDTVYVTHNNSPRVNTLQ